MKKKRNLTDPKIHLISFFFSFLAALYSMTKILEFPASVSLLWTVELQQKINASGQTNFLSFHINNILGKAKHPNPVRLKALTVYRLNSVLLNGMLPEG